MPMGPTSVGRCGAADAIPSRTPDQIVLDQHSLRHFPSQPWCKVCVGSRGSDSPHREQSEIDAVVPQTQFDDGYMGDGCPLHIARFRVGTDTSAGAVHVTLVPDSKMMDMPYMVAGTAKWVRDVGCHSTQKINDMSSDPSTYVKKRTQGPDDSILLRHMDDVVSTG